MTRISPCYLFKTGNVFFLIILLHGMTFTTTVLQASEPPMCMSFIDTSYIETTIENCDNMATICIEAAIADMLSYTITDNGAAYTSGVSPCDFDTSYAYTYSGIPGGGSAGPYQVTAWTINEVSFQGIVFDMVALKDSMNVWDNTGNWILDNGTSTIRGGNTVNSYSNMGITQVATSNMATINLNTTLNPKGASMVLDTGYHELIFMDPDDGCLDTIEVVVNCIPCAAVYTGPKTFELESCLEEQSICIDIPQEELSAYTITDNGATYTGPTAVCEVDSFYQYDYSLFPGAGTAGPYQLQSWTVNGSIFLGGFGDVSQLVDSMNVWDPMGGWVLHTASQMIRGGNTNNVYGDIQILQIVGGASSTVMPQQVASVSSVQISLDTGFHQMIFLNTTNQCEASFDFEINCTACPVYFEDSPILTSADHCDSTSNVCLPFPFSELSDWSIFIDQNLYGGVVDACAGTNTQLTLDTGTYEIIVSNSTTLCADTARVTVNCTPEVCTDFLVEENFSVLAFTCDSTATYCSSIPFTEQGLYEILDNGSAYLGAREACDAALELELSVGSHELIFINTDSNCQDTINGVVTCLGADILNLSITAGSMDTICLDTSALPGNVVTLENFCEGDAGELVIFTLDTLTACLIYEGLEEGIESACIEICNDQGYCDTTYVNVTVSPFEVIEPGGDSLPVAVDEYVFTVEGIDVTINILGNDTINGILDTIGIASEPMHGLVLVVNEQILYIPDNGYCNNVDFDAFEYFICNGAGCDTATVTVEVSCESFEIHNGFSPNGDGINDFFVIRGIDAYPNNTLKVFNRWGNQIFSAMGYRNDWGGTWQGTDLPDGTYFYHFENGEGSIVSGYLLLQR